MKIVWLKVFKSLTFFKSMKNLNSNLCHKKSNETLFSMQNIFYFNLNSTRCFIFSKKKKSTKPGECSKWNKKSPTSNRNAFLSCVNSEFFVVGTQKEKKKVKPSFPHLVFKKLIAQFFLMKFCFHLSFHRILFFSVIVEPVMMIIVCCLFEYQQKKRCRLLKIYSISIANEFDAHQKEHNAIIEKSYTIGIDTCAFEMLKCFFFGLVARSGLSSIRARALQIYSSQFTIHRWNCLYVWRGNFSNWNKNKTIAQ